VIENDSIITIHNLYQSRTSVFHQFASTMVISAVSRRVFGDQNLLYSRFPATDAQTQKFSGEVLLECPASVSDKVIPQTASNWPPGIKETVGCS
jgi:hypothetical protein